MSAIFNMKRVLLIAGPFCAQAIYRALNSTAENAEETYCDAVRFVDYRIEIISKMPRTVGTCDAIDDLHVIMQRVQMHYEDVTTAVLENPPAVAETGSRES
jgi:hypothetical protein